jgi:hypothetical protein
LLAGSVDKPRVLSAADIAMPSASEIGVLD